MFYSSLTLNCSRLSDTTMRTRQLYSSMECLGKKQQDLLYKERVPTMENMRLNWPLELPSLPCPWLICDNCFVNKYKYMYKKSFALALLNYRKYVISHVTCLLEGTDTTRVKQTMNHSIRQPLNVLGAESTGCIPIISWQNTSLFSQIHALFMSGPCLVNLAFQNRKAAHHSGPREPGFRSRAISQLKDSGHLWSPVMTTHVDNLYYVKKCHIFREIPDLL